MNDDDNGSDSDVGHSDGDYYQLQEEEDDDDVTVVDSNELVPERSFFKRKKWKWKWKCLSLCEQQKK
jgi:hypothetical protein